MPRTHLPYPPEFRHQMVELVRSGRAIRELAREFECSDQTIRNWVRQADLDEGGRDDGQGTAVFGRCGSSREVGTHLLVVPGSVSPRQSSFAEGDADTACGKCVRPSGCRVHCAQVREGREADPSAPRVHTQEGPDRTARALVTGSRLSLAARDHVRPVLASAARVRSIGSAVPAPGRARAKRSQPATTEGPRSATPCVATSHARLIAAPAPNLYELETVGNEAVGERTHRQGKASPHDLVAQRFVLPRGDAVWSIRSSAVSSGVWRMGRVEFRWSTSSCLVDWKPSTRGPLLLGPAARRDREHRHRDHHDRGCEHRLGPHPRAPSFHRFPRPRVPCAPATGICLPSDCATPGSSSPSKARAGADSALPRRAYTPKLRA